MLSAIFLIKILSGIGLIFLYRFYYGGSTSDIFNYYKDGKVIYNVLHTNPLDFFKIISGIGSYSTELENYLKINTDYWFKAFNYNLLNDNRLVIKLNAILHIISNNNIYVHSVFFSFFSFVGLTALYKAFKRFCSKKYILIVIVFFIPSVLIWSSAILKESVLMLALGMFILSFFNLLNSKKIVLNTVIVLITTFLMLNLKFYVLFSLIPGLIFLTINKFYDKNPIIIFSLIYTFVIILFFNSQLICNYNLAEILSFKQHDFINMINQSKNVGSRIDLPILQANFISFIFATPNALLNSFLRPSVFDIHSLIVMPAVIENILFFIFFILSIIYFDKSNFKKNLPFILFSISFIITLSILLGLTTPVLGALVRYKIPYLPFFLIVIMLVTNTNRINKYFTNKH